MAALEKDVTGGSAQTPLRCLVVDDEAVNRMVLSAMLRGQGFEIIEAEDGERGVEICRTLVPDLIFMDIMMPTMDGFEATTRIKEMLGDVFVPVIFLTAISDEIQLRRCIEVGGDDFLTKPYSRTLLQAKIDAALRVRAMHLDLARQRDELASYRNRQQRDLEVAKRILDNVGTREELALPNIRYLLQPMELLNGDIILAATRPTGEQCFLVGDFTGHGLPAAIGAMTVHGVFISMVNKGFGLDEVVNELNRKMCALLPVDRFLSAAILELENETGMLKVWNGGLPDVLVRSVDGEIISRFRSVNLPLGIVAPERYTSRSVTMALQPGDQVLAYSDGLVEAHSPNAELFGNQRLEGVLASPGTMDERFDALMESLAEHVQTAPQSDDISILAFRCEPELNTRGKKDASPKPVGKPPGHWGFLINLDAAALKKSEPVATVMQVMDTAQGLGALRTPLFMVLTELFSNALEHGLLGLSSDIKQGPNGFADYYEARQQRLEALQEGELTIDCQHLRDAQGGVLRIRVAHSGLGFDPASLPIHLDQNTEFKGRGIRLVRSLCESLEYGDEGREAIALYRWSAEGA